MTNKLTIEDSLLLCASDLQHSAIYDNHPKMQSCIRAVADRITALASVIEGVGRAALAAPAQAGWCKDCNPDNCGGCATPAAIDYWKDGDAIHDDLTSALDDDVARLYAKYDELYRSSCGQAPAQAGEYPPLGKGSLWRDAEGIRGYGTDPGPGPWYTTEDVHRAIDAAMAAQKDGA